MYQYRSGHLGMYQYRALRDVSIQDIEGCINIDQDIEGCINIGQDIEGCINTGH